MRAKRTALITGATSGIGKAYAVRFARNGYDLILTGRRMDKLDALARELTKECNISVKTISAELSENQDSEKLIKIIHESDNIHVLINNAGFGSGIEFSKNRLEEHMRMLQVHVIVAMKLVYAVLPQMISRREGTIINVSSLGAFMPAPGSSMYSATKMFLASFSESLHLEVHKYGIKVQCICPGFTHTDFHAHRSMKALNGVGKMLWMEAETVVDKSVKSLGHHQIVIIPGIINKLLILFSHLMPRPVYYSIIEKSGDAKCHPGFFDRAKQLVEKAVPFFFPAHTDQV